MAKTKATAADAAPVDATPDTAPADATPDTAAEVPADGLPDDVRAALAAVGASVAQTRAGNATHADPTKVQAFAAALPLVPVGQAISTGIVLDKSEDLRNVGYDYVQAVRAAMPTATRTEGQTTYKVGSRWQKDGAKRTLLLWREVKPEE